nr:hypothetical protein [Dendronalium sp. ChiSLP03b]
MGRNNFWNQGNALELCALCSNAFVQAIAMALLEASLLVGFPTKGDRLAVVGLKRVLPPSIL